MSKFCNIHDRYRRHFMPTAAVQMKQNQNVRLPRLILNMPRRSNFMTIVDFFISGLKNWLLTRGYFGSWGHALVAVAIVERFK